MASQQAAVAALIPGGLPLALVAQPGDSIRAKVKLETENVAVFGQATWEINDRWRTTGGLRWTYEQKDADLLVAVVDSTAFSAGLTGLSLLASVTTPVDDDCGIRPISIGC